MNNRQIFIMSSDHRKLNKICIPYVLNEISTLKMEYLSKLRSYTGLASTTRNIFGKLRKLMQVLDILIKKVNSKTISDPLQVGDLLGKLVYSFSLFIEEFFF